MKKTIILIYIIILVSTLLFTTGCRKKIESLNLFDEDEAKKLDPVTQDDFEVYLEKVHQHENILITLGINIPIIGRIIIGGIACALFVPFLQLVFTISQQVPPFKITALGSDYTKIYSIAGLMLITGLFILRFIMRRLKIGSVLKLGED